MNTVFLALFSHSVALTFNIGLGYGSESSEDEADDQDASDNAEDSDDEAALQERIRRKKAEFEQKMREAEEKEKTKGALFLLKKNKEYVKYCYSHSSCRDCKQDIFKGCFGFALLIWHIFNKLFLMNMYFIVIY